MNNRFEIIKNMPESKYEFGNDVYLTFGGVLLEALDKMNLDGYEEFENDTFKIIPYDWDGLQDCTCYVNKEIEQFPYSKKINERIRKYDNSHMHTIDCGSHDTNFYHKSTGVAISWRKHVSRFECVNKTITFENWEAIVEDCVKSVLGARNEEYEKEINNSNLNEYEKQLLKVSLKVRMNEAYISLCDETLKHNHDSIKEEIETIRKIANKLNLGNLD